MGKQTNSIHVPVNWKINIRSSPILKMAWDSNSNYVKNFRGPVTFWTLHLWIKMPKVIYYFSLANTIRHYFYVTNGGLTKDKLFWACRVIHSSINPECLVCFGYMNFRSHRERPDGLTKLFETSLGETTGRQHCGDINWFRSASASASSPPMGIEQEHGKMACTHHGTLEIVIFWCIWRCSSVQTVHCNFSWQEG